MKLTFQKTRIKTETNNMGKQSVAMRKFLAAARCCLQSELIWQKSLDNDFLEKLCVKKNKDMPFKCMMSQVAVVFVVV